MKTLYTMILPYRWIRLFHWSFCWWIRHFHSSLHIGEPDCSMGSGESLFHCWRDLLSRAQRMVSNVYEWPRHIQNKPDYYLHHPHKTEWVIEYCSLASWLDFILAWELVARLLQLLLLQKDAKSDARFKTFCAKYFVRWEIVPLFWR